MLRYLTIPEACYYKHYISTTKLRKAHCGRRADNRTMHLRSSNLFLNEGQRVADNRCCVRFHPKDEQISARPLPLEPWWRHKA